MLNLYLVDEFKDQIIMFSKFVHATVIHKSKNIQMHEHKDAAMSKERTNHSQFCPWMQ